jgi:hypothetical protein
MVAHELAVPLEFDVVHDLLSLNPADFAGHPAMKLPTLHVPPPFATEGGSPIFGTENICRKLVEIAGRADDPRVILLPPSDLVRNAQELVWQAMAAQVQLVLGVRIGKLPAESPFFAKIKLGMIGSLAWIDERLPNLLAALGPSENARDFSLFEVSLFCLLEHIAFRPTVLLSGPVGPRFPSLHAFAQAFATRESAQCTVYAPDPPKEIQ